MDSTGAELLSLPDGPARVAWRRSTRARRVSLRIDPCGGAVVVTLPPRAGRNAGMALLMDHAAWVSARLAALPDAVSLEPGSRVALHGVGHPIRHVDGGVVARRAAAWVARGEILVAGDPATVPARVAEFLRAEARRTLLALVEGKSRRAGVRPRRLTVKDTSSRWGSCAASGCLAFSWRLVMAPPFVQDYVAAHEVAHLRHMDHGEAFWALAASLTDHTDAAMAWLRAEGPRLLRVG
jgi:predicted metal-dependent hydrolase